jgi:hypothetical protein
MSKREKEREREGGEADTANNKERGKIKEHGKRWEVGRWKKEKGKQI